MGKIYNDIPYTSLIHEPYLDTTLGNQSIGVLKCGDVPNNLTSIRRSNWWDSQ